MAEFGVYNNPAPKPAKDAKLWSSGWKDVTLKIFGSDEKIILPIMVSSKVWDVKCMLAEMHGGVDPHRIDLVFKVGPSYKRHRNGDEVQSNLVVKGMKSFAKGEFEWPHPYMVIGAGHMGLRQAMHYTRKKCPFTLFERMHAVGGNAWVGIANKTSKLQTEGPQYQLQYDVYDRNVEGLLAIEKYNYWPSTDEILAHFQEVLDEFGVTPNIMLSTEVTDMLIHNEPPGGDIRQKVYEFFTKSRIDDSDGNFKCSCLCYYPGCLVVPHRKTWPGEDVFNGQIGYGFSHEFDYNKLKEQDGVIIGMGAFAHENVRTFVEFGGRKCYNVARHFNLMMPRMICWWVNQSACPPTAAMVLQAMGPMYEIIGLNPWNFFSVTANPERTVATIKQYTRWGISDIYFLALYFDKCEVIQAQVKRFKPRAAVLDNGRVIEDLDHVIKVIGFDGDFGVDRLMQTTENIGPWPAGDWRRFTLSDQSAIDASRFTNIAISPAVSSMSRMTHYYHTHPEFGYGVLQTGMIPVNKSEPEIGSPAYHYEPRKGTAAMMTIGGFAQELGAFEELNTKMKKASMHHLASCWSYSSACERDWYRYCKLFKDQGCTTPWPVYPYMAEQAKHLVKLEDDLRRLEEQKFMQRHGIQIPQDNGGGPAEPPSAEEMQEQQHVHEQKQEIEFLMPAIEEGDRMAFEPARKVLEARKRNKEPAKDAEEVKEWLKEGYEVKNYLIKHCRAAPQMALKNY